MRDTPSSNLAERQAAENLARSLPQADLWAWKRNRYSGRFHFCLGEWLAVIQTNEVGQVTHSQLETKKLEASAQGGLCLLVDTGSSQFWVGHEPCRIKGTDLFIWLPMHPDVRFHPSGKLSVNLAFRSPHAPERKDSSNFYITKI